MSKLICLRDDDTNYYTQYKELSEGYGKFWGDLPVTLATIPFVHGSEQKILDFEYPVDKKFSRLREWEKSATCNELSEYHKLMPVGENVDLVQQLKKLINQNKIEIAQHGITHRYNENGAEMYAENVGLDMIRSGKEYLEKVFETPINVFIPPSNSIDIECGRYVSRAGMDIFSCGSFKTRKKLDKYLAYIAYPQDIITFLRGQSKESRLPIRKKQNLWITNSLTFGVGSDDDKFLKNVLKQLDDYGAASITTHYRLLGCMDDENNTYRNRYWKLLDSLCMIEDVEFVTASQYITKLRGK